MKRTLIARVAWVATLVVTPILRATEPTWNYAVQVSATVQTAPPTITLGWPQDTSVVPNSYTVYRKALTDTAWGAGTVLAGTTTTFTDVNVGGGAAYEYQIVKNTSTYNGYGYIYAGVNAPLTENRGKVILVVDKTYASNLTTELAQLEQDLAGDGWAVLRHDVNRTDSVPSVKNLIAADYAADPANVNAVFLFGHVPVPYSGLLNPDGHPDHYGAWPADVFYGVMNGTWTDSTVNYVQTVNTDPADAARLTNVPGDGKFDQTQIPGVVQLQVGRVDLANMPGQVTWGGPATFPSELELLRQYLNKDHNYRQKSLTAQRRAVVADYFGVRNGEAFAASAFRNFAPFFGAAGIDNLNLIYNDTQGVWVPTLHTNNYLWAYGCGAGSYTTIGGLGNAGSYNATSTPEIVSNDIQAIFVLLFGSWLGDWDHTDNIMRGVLATPTHGLVCAWSGRPHWFVHPMGLGQTIGFGARLTQNNNNGLYLNQINTAAGDIHVALMGDPTLRLHQVAPPSALAGVSSGSGLSLSWTASADVIVGYYVYRSANPLGPFSRLTSGLVNGTSFVDTAPPAGTNTYMVRAIKLESTPSGTYYNASQGTFWTVGGAAASTPDTTPPTVALSAPANNATVSGSAVTVSATAADNVGVAKVQFLCDGNTLGTAVTQPPYLLTWDTTAAANGSHTLSATAWDLAGNQTTSAALTVTVNNTTSANTNSVATAWVDDALPAGASGGADGGDGWNWIGANPTPYSGALAHQSNIGTGLHEHYFNWATATLSVNTGDVLMAYIYLDPANPPQEAMLVWNDGAGWEHRAYWGANLIGYGTDGTTSRRYMGALPTAGQWVELAVPASQVGLEGVTMHGMGFSLYGGRATWDYAGKSGATTVTPPPPPPPASTNTSSANWVAGALPTGAVGQADGGDGWNWVTSNPTSLSGNPAHQSNLASGLHEHWFNWATATLAINTGDTLFAYVYLDPANPPSEVLLTWNDGASWEHRAYWGADLITYGTDNTPSRYYAGPLPAAGQWVKLSLPASAVGLEGATLQGLGFSLYNGRATWDVAGKSSPVVTAASTPTVWMQGSLPTGASPGADGGDGWNWVSSNPASYSGALAHQSNIGAGLHEHYFNGASARLSVNTGEVLFAYVYLDPANLPQEVMLDWNDGSSWEHRAYWGANVISYGADGSAGRYYMGPLPAAGQWIRLAVPASAVALGGASLQGMGFTLYGGRATWDICGKASQ